MPISVRKMSDPHLHAIRMVARNIKQQDRMLGGQIETARFNLFTSLEAERYGEAMDWLSSLDAGLGCLKRDGHPAYEPIARALKALREILEAETEEETDKLSKLVTSLSVCIAATPVGGSVERAELLGIFEACELELEEVE